MQLTSCVWLLIESQWTTIFFNNEKFKQVLWCHFEIPSFKGVFLLCSIPIPVYRNRRVQKERLSFERNNFHGNKMAQCLISNWKGKKYENTLVYENEIRKKIRATFLTDFCLRQPRYFFVLSRQSSNVYSWLPAGNGERLLCWQPSLSKRKAVRKVRYKWLRWYFDEGECAEDYFPGCSRRQEKKRKRRCSSIKKRSRPTCL